MVVLTVLSDAPLGQAIGIKEDLAMHLSQWGRVRVVHVGQHERGIDITIEIDVPEFAAPAIREDAVRHLRYWGDSQVSAVTQSSGAEQTTLL